MKTFGIYLSFVELSKDRTLMYSYR